MDSIIKPSPKEPLAVQFDVIPEELRALNTWVVWNYAVEDGDFKKPPYNPKNGRKASVSDPNSWGSFEVARSAYEKGKWCGVGLVLPSNTKLGIVGVDIDYCITPDGVISEEALQIIATLDTYTELSPSGSGIHLWMKGSIPGIYRKRGNVEMYQDGRYITITGHTIGTSTVLSNDEARLTAVYQDIFVFEEENTGGVMAQAAPRFQIYYSLEQALKRGFDAKNGENFKRHYIGDNSLWEGKGALYTSQSSADFVLVMLLLRVTNDNVEQVDRLFRKSGLMRLKWDRRVNKTETYGQKIIKDAIAKRRNH